MLNYRYLPFMGLEGGCTASHLGLRSLTDVPGIGFPESSWTHQQYPATKISTILYPLLI